MTFKRGDTVDIAYKKGKVMRCTLDFASERPGVWHVRGSKGGRHVFSESKMTLVVKED